MNTSIAQIIWSAKSVRITMLMMIGGETMIIKQYQKPFVPKYANYDYTKVYDGNGRFIGWIKIYHTLTRVVK